MDRKIGNSGEESLAQAGFGRSCGICVLCDAEIEGKGNERNKSIKLNIK